MLVSGGFNSGIGRVSISFLRSHLKKIAAGELTDISKRVRQFAKHLFEFIEHIQQQLKEYCRNLLSWQWKKVSSDSPTGTGEEGALGAFPLPQRSAPLALPAAPPTEVIPTEATQTLVPVIATLRRGDSSSTLQIANDLARHLLYDVMQFRTEIEGSNILRALEAVGYLTEQTVLSPIDAYMRDGFFNWIDGIIEDRIRTNITYVQQTVDHYLTQLIGMVQINLPTNVVSELDASRALAGQRIANRLAQAVSGLNYRATFNTVLTTLRTLLSKPSVPQEQELGQLRMRLQNQIRELALGENGTLGQLLVGFASQSEVSSLNHWFEILNGPQDNVRMFDTAVTGMALNMLVNRIENMDLDSFIAQACVMGAEILVPPPSTPTPQPPTPAATPAAAPTLQDGIDRLARALVTVGLQKLPQWKEQQLAAATFVTRPLVLGMWRVVDLALAHGLPEVRLVEIATRMLTRVTNLFSDPQIKKKIVLTLAIEVLAAMMPQAASDEGTSSDDDAASIYTGWTDSSFRSVGSNPEQV